MANSFALKSIRFPEHKDYSRLKDGNGVYGVFVGGSTFAGGGRTLRVAKLHWSTRNGHTPGNGVDPPAELRQGSWLISRLVRGMGRWGSIAVEGGPSRRWKTPN